MNQPNSKKIILGSDHAGFERKEEVRAHLTGLGFEVKDVSEPVYEAKDDYPKYAAEVARQVANKSFERGIALCGSGIGASIAANRFRGVRAALCITPEMARMSRLHNNSNVLVLGGRLTGKEETMRIVDAWLAGEFEGGRHAARIALLDLLE
jgi:ribose 5-phosphate isomerase B